MEDTPMQALRHAVVDDEIDAVRDIISEGVVGVNTVCPVFGATVLHSAIQHSSNATIECLIELGADVCARDVRGRTPLHRANTAFGARLLIRNGANVNAQSNDGTTPLLQAVTDTTNAVVEPLIAAGADVNLADASGLTPLEAAFECQSARLSTVLIRNGANFSQVLPNGMPALHRATLLQLYTTVEVLIERGASLDARDEEGNTPMDLARHDHFKAWLMECYHKAGHEPWNRREPLKFGRDAEKKIITTIACAKRVGVHLPVELWQHIFSYTTRGDFESK